MYFFMLRLITYCTILILTLSSCGRVRDITRSLMDLRQIEFELKSIDKIQLSGINLSRLNSENEISTHDLLRLAKAFKDNKLFLDCVLNVEATNPNKSDGKNLTATATISDFDFIVYFDEVKIAQGMLKESYKISPSGDSQLIPIKIRVDLMDVYKSRSYEPILDLCLALADLNDDKVKVRLETSPTIKTQLGDFSPGIINIEKEF